MALRITKDMDIMYFSSDEEFADFCIAPYAVVKETSNGTLCVEGEYSKDYIECVEEGYSFIIRDEDSKVYDRQCVCKRVPVIHNGVNIGRDTLVQLSVQNLKPYFERKRKNN